MSSLLGSAKTAERDDATAAVGTGSRATRVLGVVCLVGLATLLLFALVLTPPDQRVDEATNTVVGQFDAVRLLYVHFPTILVAYLGFVITAVGSGMFLWKKSIWWDTVAHAAAEVGALFLALTLVTGIIWGRPIWNTWWEWGDVRVMTTLMLFLMFLGYLALRRVPGDPTVRARRAAIVALISVLNIPIVNRSVEWWENRTLHQKSTATEIKWENLTFFTVFFGMVVFTGVFAWLLIHRFRLGWLERQVEGFDLEQAIRDRRAEVNRADTNPANAPAATATARQEST